VRAAVLLVLAACGGAEPPPPAAQQPRPGPVPAPVATREPPVSGAREPFEHGKASYYADSLAGHKTASGERYDPRAFTAAHRTLPFGTWIVVSRSDGRSVKVRVNDRGPFAKGRVVDLSRAAAEAIGMIRAGVVEVSLSRE